MLNYRSDWKYRSCCGSGFILEKKVVAAGESPEDRSSDPIAWPLLISNLSRHIHFFPPHSAGL